MIGESATAVAQDRVASTKGSLALTFDADADVVVARKKTFVSTQVRFFNSLARFVATITIGQRRP